MIPSYIIFYEFTSELEIYRIDTSSSPEVALSSYILAFTPSYNFTERSKFYIAIQRGVVRSTEGCGAGNEPVTNKTLWTFEILNVTSPVITLLQRPIFSNGNVSLSWESNENVTWECSLVVNSMTSSVNCSGANWRGYNLSEGRYELMITATDDAGNVATLVHTSEVDLTPPTVTITDGPPPLTNKVTTILQFTCNESLGCSYHCQFYSDNMNMLVLSVQCDNGIFTTPSLQNNVSSTVLLI